MTFSSGAIESASEKVLEHHRARTNVGDGETPIAEQRSGRSGSPLGMRRGNRPDKKTGSKRVKPNAAGQTLTKTGVRALAKLTPRTRERKATRVLHRRRPDFRARRNVEAPVQLFSQLFITDDLSTVDEVFYDDPPSME